MNACECLHSTYVKHVIVDRKYRNCVRKTATLKYRICYRFRIAKAAMTAVETDSHQFSYENFVRKL